MEGIDAVETVPEPASLNHKGPNRKSRYPFGEALQTLFRYQGRFLTHTGNINWREAAAAMPGVGYETLRKAVAGERPAGPGLITKVTEALDLPPGYFLETQLEEVRREFDLRIVGAAKAAENLRIWYEAIGASQTPRTAGAAVPSAGDAQTPDAV